MLKPTQKLLASNPDAAEMLACQEISALLALIPNVHIKHVENNALDYAIDFVIDVHTGTNTDNSWSIGCEVKTNGQPRYAETAVLKLREWASRMPANTAVVFIAPYISPAVRQLCKSRQVGYLDFAGNCLIQFSNVYIERTVSEAPPAAQRELKSIYKPKSARVLHLLLSTVGQHWKVQDLADKSGVSLGQVSNVRRALLERGWVSISEAGMQLTSPDALLDEWQTIYEGPSGTTNSYYTTLHGRALEDAIRRILARQNDYAGSVVLSSFSAADFIAPYARTGKTYLYSDEYGLAEIVRDLALRLAMNGNVQITVPSSDGPFLNAVSPLPDIVCTSPVQTYLDLFISGERGQEAAQHLREAKLQW